MIPSGMVERGERKRTAAEASKADYYLQFAGRGDEAIVAVENAMRLNPRFKSGRYLAFLALAEFQARRYADAIQSIEQHFDLRQSSGSWSRQWRSRSLSLWRFTSGSLTGSLAGNNDDSHACFQSGKPGVVITNARVSTYD